VPERSWGSTEALPYITASYRRSGRDATLFWKVWPA
jgi:hypothetical protein